MNQKEDKAVAEGHGGPHAVLMVDDEPQACKWFARLYSDEFVVLTARGGDEALALLAERGHEVAVLLTDYSMPGRDGVALLGEVRRLYPHVARLLMSAYAHKDVAMSAISQGQVERILEKPLDDALTRRVLRESLEVSAVRMRLRERIERRASALPETLGVLAHEVASLQISVRGCLEAMRERHRDVPGGQHGMDHIEQQKPGEETR